MSATKFTTTAHATAEATDKIPTDKAGVKGYNTPLTIKTYTLSLSAQYKLLGRVSSGAGIAEEITSSANIFTFLGKASLVAGFDYLAAPGADVASVGGVTDIGAATGSYIHITGTEIITGLGTVAAGTYREVKFTGACTLTYNGTSLILPGAANITTAANDTAAFRSLGSGNWICLWYKRQSEAPYSEGTWTPVATFATMGDAVFTPSVAVGTYERIGNAVAWRLQYTFTVVHTTASGALRITLPFTTANIDPALLPAFTGYSSNIPPGLGAFFVGGFISKNTNFVTPAKVNETTGGVGGIGAGDIATGATVYVVVMGGNFRAA